MDFIKRFFGSSNNNQQFNDYNDDEINRTPNLPNEDGHRRGFNVFSDPLQMHQYFEHQMNEILKTFGFQGFDGGFFSEFHNNLPSLEEGNQGEQEAYSGELRDQFLKNGYEKPPNREFDKVDKDIDGKMALGDLDSIFGRKSSSYKPENFFFGQSKTMKTIKNPDGSIETHCTIRDNEGNEEVTVCRKIEDKEYCIIKKKDKHGKEEVIENFVNLDESEKDKFFKPLNSYIPKIEDKSKKDFPFDMFFK